MLVVENSNLTRVYNMYIKMSPRTPFLSRPPDAATVTVFDLLGDLPALQSGLPIAYVLIYNCCIFLIAKVVNVWAQFIMEELDSCSALLKSRPRVLSPIPSPLGPFGAQSCAS